MLFTIAISALTIAGTDYGAMRRNTATGPGVTIDQRFLAVTGFAPVGLTNRASKARDERIEAKRRPSTKDDMYQPVSESSALSPVLFVCTGNICRSAYAEVIARDAGLAGVRFASAGVYAVTGAGLCPQMAVFVDGRGDPTAHRAQQLTRRMMEQSDLVIAMDSGHRRYILDEWPAMGRKAFLIGHVARQMRDRPASLTLDDLTGHLWQNRTTRPGDSVADPYGLGPAAAATASHAIDAHLDAILFGLGQLALSGGFAD